MLFSIQLHLTQRLLFAKFPSLPSSHPFASSHRHSKLFNGQCMVLTLRWKKKSWNDIGKLVSHCLFSKWHEKSDLLLISALSKDDLCAQHHVVNVHEAESLDMAHSLPSQNHLSKATLRAKTGKIWNIIWICIYNIPESIHILFHLTILRGLGNRKTYKNGFSPLIEALTESLVNKRKLNSTPTYNLLMFFQDFLTSFSWGVRET